VIDMLKAILNLIKGEIRVGFLLQWLSLVSVFNKLMRPQFSVL
jgi:hypothetical protein